MNNDDVRRYYAEQMVGNTYAVYEEKVDGLNEDAIELVLAADHDRVVARLKTALELAVSQQDDLRNDYAANCDRDFSAEIARVLEGKQ